MLISIQYVICSNENKINEISALDNCSLLEELWLPENSIQCISGITHLTYLKDLDLSSNKITEIGNTLSNNLALVVCNIVSSSCRSAST